MLWLRRLFRGSLSRYQRRHGPGQSRLHREDRRRHRGGHGFGLLDEYRRLFAKAGVESAISSFGPVTCDDMIDYKRHEHHDFIGAAAEALADEPLQAALIRLTSTLMAGNRRAYAALADSDQLRDHAKRIKEHTLANLDKHLQQLA